jgi:GTP-binding protein Era
VSEEKKEGGFRCGVVALVGAPNVGKSTLFNALLGQKIAIVAPKAQTTRLRVRGIMNRPGWQAILVDTPGLMDPGNLLEKGMRQASLETLDDADLVLYLASWEVKASHQLPAGLKLDPARTVAVINKVDSAPPEELARLRASLASLPRQLEISARKKTGLDLVEKLLAGSLPEGPALYPEDELTDITLRQSAAEIIREKALLFTEDEIPHSLAVEIEEYKERDNGVHAITATLYVERDSQKGILIGKSGGLLKKIGSSARLEMEQLVQAKVFLTLWVKVAKDWKKDPLFLKRIGYTSGR